MEPDQTLHITIVVNGFVVDIDGDLKKTTVFQRENADEMFEHLAKILGVHHLIYQPTSPGGDSVQQTPAPFTIQDPDI